MPPKSLTELMAVRSPRTPPPNPYSSDNSLQFVRSNSNCAYLPSPDGLLHTIRFAGPGFKSSVEKLRGNNPAMFDRPATAEQRTIFNSGWRIAWGTDPLWVSALSWFRDPDDEAMAFGGFIVTLMKQEIRGIRFWNGNSTMDNVLREQAIPAQDGPVPEKLLQETYGYPPISMSSILYQTRSCSLFRTSQEQASTSRSRTGSVSLRQLESQATVANSMIGNMRKRILPIFSSTWTVLKCFSRTSRTLPSPSGVAQEFSYTKSANGTTKGFTFMSYYLSYRITIHMG